MARLEVGADQTKIDEIANELSARSGIHRILAEVRSGMLAPGDDLLFAVVAGDLRTHANAALDELRARMKAEAIIKTEHLNHDSN